MRLSARCLISLSRSALVLGALRSSNGPLSPRSSGSLVESLCSTDVMANYTSREDLRATVAKALEHNVRTSDGMNWNLQDLVYEALSEEWGRRDGEISDLWADDGPSGYQPPSYEPVNPERRTPQTPSDGLI